MLLFIMALSLVAEPQALPEAIPATPAPACEKPALKNQRNRFLLFGLVNPHPRLKESEARIDRQINNTLGALLPSWEDPTTFRDWADEWRIANILLGYGENINEKLTWFVATTWAEGTIESKERFSPLGLPLDVAVKFTRNTWIVEGGMEYYPWGSPPGRRPTASRRT